MNRSTTAALLIGVVVCLPLLALQKLGAFHNIATELGRHYPEHLPTTGPLQSYPWAGYVAHTVLAFLSAWACIRLSSLGQRLAFIIGLVFLVLLLSPLLALQGILFEPFSGAAAALIAGLLGCLFAPSRTAVERFREFFEHRLTASGFEQLLITRPTLSLTGSHEVSTITCKLLNSAELAAEMTATDFEQLSSAFLQSVSAHLVEAGAYLDSCTSQGVVAQVGFPVAVPEHPLKACLKALALRKHLTELTATLEERWKKKIVTGIGLASGPAHGGLIGPLAFQHYSIQGQPAELSRRLCHLNALYGSTLLIASSTFLAVKEVMEVRPMELLTTGTDTAREVYELLGEKGSLNEAEGKARDAFWQGIVALRQSDPKAALTKFKAALIVGKDDAPLNYFKARAEELQKPASTPAKRSEDHA